VKTLLIIAELPKRMFEKWLAVILIAFLPPLIPPYKGGKPENPYKGGKPLLRAVQMTNDKYFDFAQYK
jgi:hypothetical protein